MSADTSDLSEVKKCLEEAGCYDEAMSKEDKIATYKAIRSSQDTANVEIQQRLKTKEVSIAAIKTEPELPKSNPLLTPFKARQWSKRTNETTPLSTPKKSRAEEINDRMSRVDMYDAVPSQHKPLEIIHYKRQFVPFYYHESLQDVELKAKIRLIQEYHLKLAEDLNKFARKSLNFAQWCNPIHTSTKFNGSLEKRPAKLFEGEEEEDEEECENNGGQDAVYISRGGRQIKRKTYLDGSDEENEKKKARPETQKSVRRGTAKKLSNAEIMGRSSLFADSPTRSLKLLSNSTEEDEKNKKAEKEIQKFEATLLQADDDEDDNFDIKVTSSRFPPKPVETVTSSSSHDEDVVNPNFVKLHVIPPVMGRKGIKRTQSLQVAKPAIPSTSMASPSTRPVTSEAESSTPTRRSQKPLKKKTKCPICNQEFLQEDIEEHASTCGLTNELEIQNNLPNKDTASQTCHICDAHFPFNNDYEVHVTNCIRKSRLK